MKLARLLILGGCGVAVWFLWRQWSQRAADSATRVSAARTQDIENPAWRLPWQNTGNNVFDLAQAIADAIRAKPIPIQ